MSPTYMYLGNYDFKRLESAKSKVALTQGTTSLTNWFLKFFQKVFLYIYNISMLNPNPRCFVAYFTSKEMDSPWAYFHTISSFLAFWITWYSKTWNYITRGCFQISFSFFDRLVFEEKFLFKDTNKVK